MTGRDPDEPHRTATPLELLFDLTVVVSFSLAGSQTAHLLEVGHWGPAIGGFCFAVFAIWWAWINYSWLASAYDNDDVFFRLATLAEMIGVLVLALGIPPLFHSLDAGAHVDTTVVAAGYVIMRLATVALWLRAARHDPTHRRTALTYAACVSGAQLCWIVLIVLNMPLAPTLALTVCVIVFELAGPYIAEHGTGGGTPWHAHHIAERYGLLVIITLGEIVLGTILAISAVIEQQGWSVEAMALAFGGTALAFGLWWAYFTMPSAAMLARFRERGFTWGYVHYVIFLGLAATGAGLHVAASEIDGTAEVSTVQALLTVVVPVGVVQVGLLLVHSLLLRQHDALRLGLFIGSIVVLSLAVVAVAAGASFGVGILITAGSPFVIVIGFELVGHRRQEIALERALTD
ncbi:low temperature requirement protein A [Agromyces sp. NPDC056379]|uniref:low temperature requirement protein A n=1 Tax=unclassified Agromyces TaxID=2639701 RepID=UPI0035D6B6CF